MATIAKRREPAAKHVRLVSALTTRFGRSATSSELPLVVVNQVSRGSGKHVLVVWDDWKELAGSERGRIISDAYAAAHPDEHTSVTVPIGVTAAEALGMGYLAYGIEAIIHQEDRVTPRQVTDVMKKVGGILVQVGTDASLRFATRQQAESAYRALTKLSPSIVWALIRESSSSDES